MDPAFSAVHPEPYWSSTSSVRQPDTAFWVSFGDGHSGGGAVKTAHLFVRAVRVRPDESVLDGAPDPAGPVPSGNGDVNASGTIDVSDAVYLLGWLFLGTDPPVAIPCPPRGGGRLPATGQISCYDESGGTIPCDSVEFPGQDGFHRAGCETEPRFVDNGDGTVTDRCTALVWQKDTADVDQNGSIGEEDLLNWADALQYCDQLEFAHRDDWRLPNVRELFSIADFARFEPAIDPVFGAAPPVGPLRGMYWTSTTHLRTPDDAWTVPVTTGSVTDSQKRVSPVDNNVQFVRAVRGP
jgi:hypothetical protein